MISKQREQIAGHKLLPNLSLLSRAYIHRYTINIVPLQADGDEVLLCCPTAPYGFPRDSLFIGGWQQVAPYLKSAVWRSQGLSSQVRTAVGSLFVAALALPFLVSSSALRISVERSATAAYGVGMNALLNPVMTTGRSMSALKITCRGGATCIYNMHCTRS